MATCMAVQPYLKVPLHGYCVTELSLHKGSCIQNQRVSPLSSWNIHKSIGFCSTNLKAIHFYAGSHIRYCSLGTLINADGSASDWIPVIDQVLLMASVFLTHVAGVIPTDKSLLSPQERIPNNVVALEGTSSPGSAKDTKLKFAWNTVKDKILDSINAIEQGVTFEIGNKELEQHRRQPSSLCALAVGPRFRLLWTSFQWLKKEVDNISRSSSDSGTDYLQKVFCEIIERSSLSICTAWLREELRFANGKHVEELVSLVFARLTGSESILQNIIKSGKKDLYTELLCVLTCGPLSQGCCHDYSFFTLHGISLLEDLVITLADGIASMYLELISVDSNMSSEMNDLGLNLCTMSTRALQRLRNEVALNQWLYQNVGTVVAMYEDRFDLFTLQRHLAAEPSTGETEKLSWWKKLIHRRSRSAASPLCVVVISSICVPLKRTKELRVLTGWRYYFSLYLEFADIAMPFIRTLVAKVSDAISFFLVCLIGRSLGLIYTGIRQSLRWK